MAGSMDFLRNNNMAMTQLGLGLLSGRTGQEQAALGAQGLAGAMNQNKTMQYLEKVNPQLAAEVRAGRPIGSAWEEIMTQRTQAAQPRNNFMAAGGSIFNKDTGEWLTAPAKPVDEYRTLTGDERQQLGIPEGDPRVYQVAPNKQISAVGGAGQTINVGNEVEARRTAAAQAGLTPDDPAYQGFILTGKLPREDAQTLTATDKKAMWSAEDDIPVIDNTIASLQQARGLNRKTFTGTGAGMLGTIGTNVPGAGMILDTEKAKATSEFNKLMSMEAIQSMAQTLKGATTDSELARFVEILADPSTDPDIRERTIDRMLSLANRVKDVKVNRINELRGKSPAGVVPAQPLPSAPTGNRTRNGVQWSVE